jgi:endonuclease G
MGCYGVVGTGSAGSATTINNGNITVPSIFEGTCYTSSGAMMLAELQQALVIAVNTPNINTTGAWEPTVQVLMLLKQQQDMIY